MTYEAYAALPGVNATSIKAGVTSMLHMHNSMTGEVRKATPALRWGKLVHLAVLEPEVYGSVATIWTGGRRYGKAWDAFVDESGGEEWIVKADENAELLQMTAAVHGNPDAHRLIESSAHEQTVTWDGGKARVDMAGEGWLADLKTTARIDGFGRQFFNLGYDLQMGWYADGAGVDRAFVIVLESAAPFDCVVYKIPDHILERGRTRAQEIARHYKACCICENWPGVGNGESMLDLPVPAWVTGGSEAAWVPEETTEAKGV